MNGKVSKLTRPIFHYKWPLGSDEKPACHLSNRNLWAIFTLGFTCSNLSRPWTLQWVDNVSLGKWSLMSLLLNMNNTSNRGPWVYFWVPRPLSLNRVSKELQRQDTKSTSPSPDCHWLCSSELHFAILCTQGREEYACSVFSLPFKLWISWASATEKNLLLDVLWFLVSSA